MPKSAAEIRSSFIDFFLSKQHNFVRSSPVAPQDDPTLLFINAGMNQFKGIFLGDNPKGYRRVANSQKCIRVSGKHNDLDEVGKDTYHHTLFEMLGNWSFGDYYKQEAIEWAWELLTKVWKLPQERLFVTVYKDDDEAADIWEKVSGLPKDRIMRFAEKDNFWEMGETGPCGPCSEIHFDKGDLKSQDATFADEILGVNGENDRYIEIWNLVFIQYERLQSGELRPLEQKHVDTGMGFERVCSILQGVESNYDTDVFRPIIDKIAEFSGVAYSGDESGTPHRVIADHLRAVSFAIADGVMPSNEGRGYVLRRILRRASRYARLLGQEEPFISRLVPVLVDVMGAAFPELQERKDFVLKVIESEEERFIKTLGTGLERFARIVEELDGTTVIPGDKVFVLYDTYGFPPDLTRILAEEKSLTIDEAGFEASMEEQKERARNAQKDDGVSASGEGWIVLDEDGLSEFVGYDSEECAFRIVRYREDDGVVSFVSDKTPFYAESGGQVGEKGRVWNDGVELAVFDTVKLNDAWIHKAKVVQGDASPQNMEKEFKAAVDSDQRLATRRNHSATHLLQKALQEILGDHVAQQGSRVSADSLRFDFSHFQAVSDEEIIAVENLVNEKIRANYAVDTKLEDLEAAKAAGAMALFGEKYEDEVRVVNMGGFSVELCGGLHVKYTGDIGAFRILSEASTASGVRRIEAVSGALAIAEMQKDRAQLQSVRNTLKCKADKLITRLESVMEGQKQLEKEKKALEAELAAQKIGALFSDAQEVQSIPVWVKEVEGVDAKGFKAMLEGLPDGLPQEGIAVLTLDSGESGSLAVAVSPLLVKKGVKAGDLVRKLAEVAGGKGGGRPDKAQAGTRTPEKLGDARAAALDLIKEVLS
jgi:alanyl-tRNA synthetase